MNDEVVEHEEGESAVGRPVLVDAPAIAIAQPASSKRPESVPEGQWYAPDSGTGLGKKLMVVPIASFLTRSYFPKTGDPNLIPDSKVPRCSSTDAKFPITRESPPLKDANGEVAFVDNCAECAYGHWRTNVATKERIAPLCSESINLFVVATDETGEARIGRMRFTRTGYKPATQLMKAFAAIFPPKPMFETTIEATISGLLGQDRGQRYFEPRLRVVGPTSKFFDAVNGVGAWKDRGQQAFRELLAQWPDLHERIKARVAQGDDADAEYVLPF